MRHPMQGEEFAGNRDMLLHEKRRFFRRSLDLPHGIPSDDTFAHVFQGVDPEELIGAWTE